ncbi:MAG: hypothetical protein GEU73_15320 [Chloroflexi bacterium]|nr:hypothetical protein [Chloroflexota bacterium]
MEEWMEDQEDQDLVEREEETRYFLDVDWYDGHNLSFSDVVQVRMCEQCQARLGEEVEERYPVADRRTGRVTYEVRRVKYGVRPMAVIRDCCSRKKGFITTEMPTLEAVFRILLANANQPMPLEHIREQLREWCPTGRCQWLLLPLDVLSRVVERDQFYGLRRHELAEVP